MNRLALPASIYRALVAQARTAAPIEACGILAGRDGRVEVFHPMTNIDASADHFMMEAKEQFTVIKAIRAAGQQILAVHHSHPATPARPSPEDIRLANTPDVVYTILSLANPDEPSLRGFIIDGAESAEIPVVITEHEHDDKHQVEALLRLPERIGQDVAGYGAQVARLQRGEINATVFRAFRVPMGVYEHRQVDRFMVRVRLGAGLVLPHQLERIAELGAQYGDGILHVTTRQDIQIHHVGLQGTIPVQEKLLEVGLSARGGGGNTVRNVTACPRASVCPKAVFDVAPHAIATAESLLRNQRSFNLPRKYKIAFSGCNEDCAFASVNDLGFFAHERDGQQGFAVYAGGGLGPQAAAGVLIEQHIEAGQIFAVAETVERLFDRLGDRANKHQARLRHVLRRLGSDDFVAEYRAERAAVEREGLAAPIPEIRPLPLTAARTADPTADTAVPAGFLAERDPARLTMHIQLENGRIPAADLVKVAHMSRDLGLGLVVATQQQDLLVLGIARESMKRARAALSELSIDARPRHPKIVACAGASTCKLGLCLSPGLAEALEQRLRSVEITAGPEVIRLSGCPNSCGNHVIAPLGFEGRAKRHDGRLMPLYEVLVGGKPEEGKAGFGQRLGAVPAQRIPDLVAAICAQGLTSPADIRPVVEHFAKIPEPTPDELYVDVGGSGPFSLAGRGPGECGAGVLDVVKIDLDEADASLAAADKATGPNRSQEVHRTVAASARALLPLFGVDVRKDREVFAAATQHLVAPGWLAPETERLFAAVMDWRMGDRPALDDVLEQARAFQRRVRDLFHSLDANLHFRLPKVTPSQSMPGQAAPPASTTKLLDLRGVACPMNFVKAKVALEKLAVGTALEVLLDHGAPVANVSASFTEQGQEVLAIKAEGPCFRVSIKRKK